mmetsp:Transcript_24036/g.24284  ORF Transcript_24036/g.24284 Transcript_24036/m.24284 type:complete len:369 (+) Transcript_24036:2-1108(+)
MEVSICVEEQSEQSFKAPPTDRTSTLSSSAPLSSTISSSRKTPVRKNNRTIPKNTALVLITPRLSQSQYIQTIIKDIIKANKIEILSEGCIDSKVISERNIFEKYFSAITESAVQISAQNLQLKLKLETNIVFQKIFDCQWESAVSNGEVFNANEACDVLDVDMFGLATLWGEAEKAGKVVCLDRGVYCGLISTPSSEKRVLCLNGFYGAMREEYVAPEAVVHYMELEWEESSLSWRNYLRRVVGRRDAGTDEEWEGSIRGMLSRDWETLGLDRDPNQDENDDLSAIQISTSAFESLAQRYIWLDRCLSLDLFGAQLLSAGLSLNALQNWCCNPRVNDGERVFTFMDDCGSKRCLAITKLLINQHSSV